MGVSLFTQDLTAFPAERAKHLHRSLVDEFGTGIDRVFALVWPNYEPPISPIPQKNRGLFAEWGDVAGVQLWGWFNAREDQVDDARQLAELQESLSPPGWLLDIEGHWVKGGKLTTLCDGARATGVPIIASLAGSSASHVEYDFRALDKLDAAIDWQAYFDSGEGPSPAIAVRELYRSSFVIPGWEYRHRMGTHYGWGKVTGVKANRATLDSYRQPGPSDATFAVQPREWGWFVHDSRLMRGTERVGEFMGRARYEKIRVTLDVTRGAADKRSLGEWSMVAASARVPGAQRRPISVYMAEHADDELIAAILEGHLNG